MPEKKEYFLISADHLLPLKHDKVHCREQKLKLIKNSIAVNEPK